MTLLEPDFQKPSFCPYCGLEYVGFRGHEHGREFVVSRCLGCERSVQDYVEPEKESKHD